MASKRISRLFKILAGAVADAHEIFQLEGRLERFVHFWALVAGQFIRHRCFERASALSYSTLLALIPLLAIAINVTSGWFQHKGEDALIQFVEKAVSSITPQAEIPLNLSYTNAYSIPPTTTNSVGNDFARVNIGTNAVISITATNAPSGAGLATTIDTQREVAQWIHELVEKTSNGALGVFGLIGLIFTAILLLRGIEDTFNDIWGVTRGRSWFLQITLYWTIITFGPILLSSTLALSSSAYLEHTRTFVESSFLAPIIKHLLPITVLSFTLGLFYKFTPNTKVDSKAAMIGGFCAAAAWHFYNQLSFLLAARALGASKLYGSIFLFVLLMGGLYILWVILLFGAQIAYAFQNRTAYLQDRLAENVNQRGREFVALRIMTSLGKRFKEGQCPATVTEISTELSVPSRLTQSVLRVLAATRLVTEVAGPESAFMPARPLDAINVHNILIAMRTGVGQELPGCDSAELAEIYGEFARIEQAERSAASGVSLLALANRLSTPAALPEPKNVEPEKTVDMTGATVKIIEPEPEPEPVEPPKSAPALSPEKIETPPTEEKKPAPPRREAVRPDEDTDFPL